MINNHIKYLLLLIIFVVFQSNGKAQIKILVPDTTIISMDASGMLLPVKVEGLTNSTDSISSYTIELEYDASIIEINSYSLINTKTFNFTTYDNSNESGVYSISGAGVGAIKDDGVLFYLNVSLKSIGKTGISFKRLEVNEGQPSAESENGLIIVDSYEIPPTIISPLNNTTVVPISPVLVWSRRLLYSEYEIQYSENESLTSDTFLSIKTDTSTQINNLKYETDYYWRVRAVNKDRASNWSEISKFTTQEKENTPPIVRSKMGSITIDEDFDSFTAIILDTVFTDLETSRLDYEIINEPSLLEAQIVSRGIILNSIENLYGADTLIIKATDESSATVFDTLFIDVLPVNDLPFIVEIPDTLKFNQGETLNINYSNFFKDIDHSFEELSINITTDPDDIKILIDEESSTIEISSPSFTGLGYIFVTVVDAEEGRLEVTIPVYVSFVTSSELEDGVVSTFKLSQNYPNPFNPSTNIEFSLPVASLVELKIFDLTGREVADLLSGVKTSGNHTVSFDASTLSSGVYIYRIKAGDFVETRKMLLIK